MFGHFSHRSEWQLVKVDYKSIFDRRCAEEDYRPWQLHSQVGRGRAEVGSWVEGMRHVGGKTVNHVSVGFGVPHSYGLPLRLHLKLHLLLSYTFCVPQQ